MCCESLGHCAHSSENGIEQDGILTEFQADSGLLGELFVFTAGEEYDRSEQNEKGCTERFQAGKDRSIGVNTISSNSRNDICTNGSAYYCLVPCGHLSRREVLMMIFGRMTLGQWV